VPLHPKAPTIATAILATIVDVDEAMIATPHADEAAATTISQLAHENTVGHMVHAPILAQNATQQFKAIKLLRHFPTCKVAANRAATG
jgi:hypothetical protein